VRFITNQSLSREQAEELLVSPKAKLSVDIETVSLDFPLPLGIGVAVSPDLGFYFFNPRDELLSQTVMSSEVVIFHNAKFDIPLLRVLGYSVSQFEDTKMIAYAAGILDNSLEALSESILHRPCPSVTSQWRKPNQGNIAIDHVKMGQICIIHACNTYALEQKLPKTQLYRDIDKPCVELLIEMEHWGLLIDQYRLTLVEQQAMNRASPMEEELLAELGVENLASNPQVATALRTKGIIGTRKTKSDRDSVGEESLRPLNLPLTNKLLEWRSVMKTLQTYIPAFRKVDTDGRVHTHFGHTNTGRWSSSKPNLQNITRDEKFSLEEV